MRTPTRVSPDRSGPTTDVASHAGGSWTVSQRLTWPVPSRGILATHLATYARRRRLKHQTLRRLGQALASTGRSPQCLYGNGEWAEGRVRRSLPCTGTHRTHRSATHSRSASRRRRARRPTPRQHLPASSSWHLTTSAERSNAHQGSEPGPISWATIDPPPSPHAVWRRSGTVRNVELPDDLPRATSSWLLSAMGCTLSACDKSSRSASTSPEQRRATAAGRKQDPGCDGSVPVGPWEAVGPHLPPSARPGKAR